MEIIKTEIPELLILEPKKFADSRGFFLESYNKERFFEAGIKNSFVQDNFSSSQYGVIRGLHYQLAPYSQAKLIQVIKGKLQIILPFNNYNLIVTARVFFLEFCIIHHSNSYLHSTIINIYKQSHIHQSI